MNQNNDTYQKVTNIILSLLESAQNLNYRQPWVKVGGGSPVNIASKKGYRGINFFMLSIIAMMKGYQVNRWLSLKQANELGGKVKKGEKSSPVVLYKKTYFDKNGKRFSPDEVLTMSDIERKGRELFSKSLLYEYNVFNVAQVEGLPSELYLTPQGKTFSYFEKDEEAEELLNLSGAKISYEGNHAYYSPVTDEIILPPRNQFEHDEPFYDTAFHELAHWTGHATRLNRVKKGEDGKNDYAVEELVAELTTAFVCSSIGFESQITNNAAYLKSWIKVLKEDNKIVLRVCTDAQKAADFILQPLHAEQEQAA